PQANVLAAVPVVFVGGIRLERLLLTPLESDRTERKDEHGLIVTFGLAFFLRNTAIIAFGPFPLKPPSFIPGVQRIGNLIVTNDRLVAGGMGIALILALVYLLQRTIWGQTLGAVGQSRDASAIVGINSRRFNSFAFGIGAALAAAAGAISEDERAAGASGVAVARFRILAFAMASGFAGPRGGFYAHCIGIRTPSVGDLDEMAVRE